MSLIKASRQGMRFLETVFPVSQNYFYASIISFEAGLILNQVDRLEHSINDARVLSVYTKFTQYHLVIINTGVML